MASICTSANDINNNQSSEDSFDNIWVAATNGDVDVVRNFLLTGIDVNIQDENTGNSPIHSAASYGQVEMIEFQERIGSTSIPGIGTISSLYF